MTFVLLTAATSRHTTPGQRATVLARAVFGRNLITNGGAEIEQDGHANGWKPSGIVESEQYGHTAGEWDAGVVGAPQGGERYFRMSVPNGSGSIAAEQWVSIAAESSVVDDGRVGFELSGWFGSMIGDPGAATLSVTFIDVNGDSIAFASIEPVPSVKLPKPVAGSASLARQTRDGIVPAGARRLRIRLHALSLKFAECADCSALGVADNLSLVLTRKD